MPSAQDMADLGMAHVDDLFIYPLKSGRAIPVASARLAATGFEWDRHWMAVDPAGTFISQRTRPQLARVIPTITPEGLALNAQGLPTLDLPLEPTGDIRSVRVWKDTCTGLDQGDEAAKWITEALGSSARLVRLPRSTDRLADSQYAGPHPVPMTFADGFPLLVCNRASLANLNTRMPEPIPMERFRPNIVLDGLPEFAEDGIDAMRIGSVTFRFVKPCTRCVITSTDQQTGLLSTNPLPVLRTFRFDRKLLGVKFGENAVVTEGVGAVVERGMPCSVVSKVQSA